MKSSGQSRKKSEFLLTRGEGTKHRTEWRVEADSVSCRDVEEEEIHEDAWQM